MRPTREGVAHSVTPLARFPRHTHRYLGSPGGGLPAIAASRQDRSPEALAVGAADGRVIVEISAESFHVADLAIEAGHEIRVECRP